MSKDLSATNIDKDDLWENCGKCQKPGLKWATKISEVGSYMSAKCEHCNNESMVARVTQGVLLDALERPNE